MVIGHVANDVSQFQNASSNTLTITAPTDGNLLNSNVFFRNVSATNPTGYTTVLEEGIAGSFLRMTYKVASGEGTTVGWTFGNSQRNSCSFMEFNGFVGTPTLDVSTSTFDATGDLVIATGATAVSTVADAVVISAAGARAQFAGGDTAWASATLGNQETVGSFTDLADGWRVVNATAAYSDTYTYGTGGGSNESGIIATFYDDAAVAFTPRLTLLGVG